MVLFFFFICFDVCYLKYFVVGFGGFFCIGDFDSMENFVVCNFVICCFWEFLFIWGDWVEFDFMVMVIDVLIGGYKLVLVGNWGFKFDELGY